MHFGWISTRLKEAGFADYNRVTLGEDAFAGLVTAFVLIPQGMAFAALAGLPVQAGLYAGITAPVIYAFLSSSRVLSVGPVSVISLLVAGTLKNAGSTDYLNDALILALLSGLILWLMALVRAQVLVQFFGHPVLSGFTAAAAVMILVSQVPALTGGYRLSLSSIPQGASFGVNLGVGLAAVLLLYFMKRPWLRIAGRLGLGKPVATAFTRLAPMIVLVLFTLLAGVFALPRAGLDIVGSVPEGLPVFSLPSFTMARVSDLLPGAFLISVIAFVESVAIGKDLATRQRLRLDSGKELWALGAANLAASASGGLPVAASFGRSYMNFQAGARTQVSAIVAAFIVALLVTFFTQWFFYLPKSVLAAVIVVSVLPLVSWHTLRELFHYDRAEALAYLMTFGSVLIISMEAGLLIGVVCSLAAFVWRSSRPHIATVGRLAGGDGYRNVERYQVKTWPDLLLLRIDRSLYFANSEYVEDVIQRAIARSDSVRHVVLICSGVNDLDSTAMEKLEHLSESLQEAGVTLNFSEIKGPVQNRIKQSGVYTKIFHGRTFTTTDEAVRQLTQEDFV